MTTKRPYSIGRPNEKIGYFEIRYRHGEALKTCCVVGHGFQDAILRFEGFQLGAYTSIREVRQEDFEAWFNVSLQAAQSVQEVRSGVHL